MEIIQNLGIDQSSLPFFYVIPRRIVASNLQRLVIVSSLISALKVMQCPLHRHLKVHQLAPLRLLRHRRRCVRKTRINAQVVVGLDAIPALIAVFIRALIQDRLNRRQLTCCLVHRRRVHQLPPLHFQLGLPPRALRKGHHVRRQFRRREQLIFRLRHRNLDCVALTTNGIGPLSLERLQPVRTRTGTLLCGTIHLNRNGTFSIALKFVATPYSPMQSAMQ